MEDRFSWTGRGVARIAFGDGSLLLPARTPYDWETVVDNVRHRVRRDGWARLEIDGRSCDVRPIDASAGVRCADCGCRLEDVACRVGLAMLCFACVQSGATVRRGLLRGLAS